MSALYVSGWGGARLHVAVAGPEGAPPILFLHGWSQHHLSWKKQLDSGLADDFRLIAPDLRGHGASDKPDDAEAYDNPEPWAADVAAIIDQLELERPLLVGWSMGGWIVGDYVRRHGDHALAGVALHGVRARAGASADPSILGLKSAAAQALGMYAEDQGEQAAAAVEFVKACAGGPLSKTDLAFMVGLNMLCPPHIRHACRTRDIDLRAPFAAITKPVLLIQGEADRVCHAKAFEETAAALRHAETKRYPGCGHLAFWEAPARFNADIAAFARQVFGSTP